MECLKGKGQSSTSSSDGAQRSGLGGHAVHSPHSHCTPGISDCIKVGSFYEIDHTKLSPKALEQLKSVRVVMVNEKTPLKVSLRFPNIYSLSKHLKDGSGCNPYGKKLPALDDKYIMGVNRAVEVLSRRIPPQELAEQRNSWGFWSGPSAETSSTPSQALNDGVSFVVPKKGCCWSELKGTGMVQWGKRRQVRFLRRHEETNFEGLSSDVKSHEEGEEENDEEREKDDHGVVAGTKEEEEEEEEEKMEDSDNCDDSGAVVREPKRETRSTHKRKCHGFTRKKTAKKVKRETQNQIQVYKSKRKTVKNSIDRWSADRYKLAEQNMLKILKAKGAVFGKPILRPALRAEARKLIGDTGLLDHLLKHMAGKVAPGGAERFRRRHNADGAMEYWLESADLVNIRKEAGVPDPYWTPPPGWQPGDNPDMHPVCAKELREVKEELRERKEELRELKEEMAIVKREMQELVSKKESLILLEQEMHAELVRMKARVELVEISQACMKEMMEKLQHKVAVKDPSSKSELETITKVTSNDDDDDDDDETKGEELQKEKEEDERQGGKREKEDRAAKIERLKSGFRICKPQGTFLWPADMGMSPPAQVAFQLVPTPPSASSSTAPSSCLLPQPVAQQYGPFAQTSPPPLKPLAERRAVPMAAVSSVLTQDSAEPATNISLINLNEVPKGDSNTASCGTRIVQTQAQPPADGIK